MSYPDVQGKKPTPTFLQGDLGVATERGAPRDKMVEPSTDCCNKTTMMVGGRETGNGKSRIEMEGEWMTVGEENNSV